MKADFKKYTLDFKRPGGTSRGVLHQKETYFLRIESDRNVGFGECALFKGLSYDDRPGYEEKLEWLCRHIDMGAEALREELKHYPSILFGWEQAARSLASADPFELYPSAFTNDSVGIEINGLIWMGDREFMEQQVEEKLVQGFDTIKLKIGALEFQTELDILDSIRQRFSKDEITLRVDANGAFAVSEAMEKLERLSVFDLHSIEQPIRAGQWDEMARLCEMTPVPIALDEELIGIVGLKNKRKLLDEVSPQFVILKPSLVGGFNSCDEWVSCCDQNGVGWWITSALESNLGLNAIAQYTFTLGSSLPQGLGTGSLFHNNLDSPLEVSGGKLFYKKDQEWSNLEDIFKVD